ncbi:hypothetical protein CHS0354_037986 [Potamilus streckersoni]|uniref:Uncharacterized protein n=1 Tax=Potamilus streckersoni TaxID=2493646 RepID=A0AAE0RQJ3_9BIVA|nr:hypothetical protein CHS0354_037986 [Potamilus streckersoni]
MVKRGYDLSSTDQASQDPKQCSTISSSRIAIIVLVTGAVIAGIVVAVYFTSIPASQSESDAITRVKVSKMKTFQGEVRIEQDWNENLKDLNSNFSIEKAYNFTSAMDVVYRNNTDYNGTVVDAFKNGSIIIVYRIYWVVTVIREIGQQKQIISEVEANPVDTAKLIQLIKDNLPRWVGANVTQISELQAVTTTTAVPTTTNVPATTKRTTTTTKTPATTTITTSNTLQPTASNTLNSTITTRTTKEANIFTNSTPTTPELTTTTTTTKEPTTTTTTIPSTLLPTINTTPNPSTTKTASSTPEPITNTRSTSTTPEHATTTTTKEPTTTTTTTHSTLQPTITITTATPKPSTTTTTTTTIPPLSTTIETTSNTPKFTITITKEPTIITTAPSTTYQSTISTITTTTTPKPITSTTATTSTPKPTTTTETTSTTPDSTIITSTVATLSDTLQAITIIATTNTPEPNTINTMTTAITPHSKMTPTTPQPANTSTTITPKPTTSTTNVPTTTPNPCKLSAATLACQFEDTCLCGYRNLRNGSIWYQRSGHFFKLPQYDHTYGNETGRFMVAYNTSNLATYYNLLGNFGPGYPYRLEYSNSTLISPRENFTTESCVYFYYYLNGTAVRPNPLSAELYVYISNSNGIKLAWYDSINRTINGWLKGWVSVLPGYAEVIFVAKTITTTTVWPGVVALDDVSVILRPCPSSPDCGPDTFQCMTTRVCIPVYMQCDGGNDCVDNSDEDNCTSKPDYQVKLINGVGSYGSIAIFYQGLWRPVCMSKYSLMAGNSTVVKLACKKVGYNGRYQGAFVNSWQQPVQYAMQVSCSSLDEDLSNCSMNLTETGKNTSFCYYYQAAFCSNDDCFSGERLCPPDYNYSNYSSSMKCISYQYLCDGIPDCPGATDELNCANCSTSEFECMNHECIPTSQQCDGSLQCGDNSDEYGCVIGTNNMLHIYHSQLSEYLPVCYNNMNDTLANKLCSLSGQGSYSHYQPYTYIQAGTVLIPQLNVAVPSLVPGYTVSVQPCNATMLQCTSIECGSTMFDDSKLPKILYGRDAVLGQFPWQIALYGGGYFACGGSIIHPHWVLTSAHCIVYMESYTVTVGAVDVGISRSENSQGRWYNSSRTYINPFYNIDFDNDISLVYIDEPIVFSNYVRPICIASRGTVEEMLNEGYNAECYVGGWGRNQNLINGVTGAWLGKLQIVRVYLYNKEECNQIYYKVYRSYPQNTTVCVDNQNFGAPTCNGDSGGPLICRNSFGRFEVLGTLSWGYFSCFKEGYPDIYQLSYPHADWIEEITGLNFTDLTMDMD